MLTMGFVGLHGLPTLKPRGRRVSNPQCRQREREPSEWSAERLGFTEIGVVLGAHGVRGDVRVRSTGDFGATRLSGDSVRYLLRPGRIYPRAVNVTQGRRAPQSGVWLVRVSDAADTREAARELAGSRVYIRDSDVPSLEEDELSAAALVGLRVLHEGSAIGVVRTVHFAADVGKKAGKLGSDTLEIALGQDVVDVFAELNRTSPSDVQALEECSCVLLPFVREIVPRVDVEEGFIEIDPPEGLLDISVVNRLKKPRAPRGLLMAARDVP